MTTETKIELEVLSNELVDKITKEKDIFELREITDKYSNGEITEQEWKEKYAGYEKEIKETRKVLNKLKKLIRERKKEEINNKI